MHTATHEYIFCRPTLLVAFLLTLFQQAQAELLTGTYTGDGIDNRSITQLGFQPDVVIIKGDTVQVAVCRTSTMTGDNAKPLDGDAALTANLVQSLDASGFTIGTDNRVNEDTVVYYWIAFKTQSAELAVGSYTGDATDNRTIDISDTSSSADFQPDYVLVMSANDKDPFQRSSAMTGDTSFGLADGAASDHIQAFVSNGFEVGTQEHANEDGKTFHYIAWKAVSGKMNVGSYTGNGTDDRNITGVGFEPEYVMVKVDANQETVHHPASLGPSTDASLQVRDVANKDDQIQALQADGFQVGKVNTVNSAATTYYWMAFARQSPPTLVKMRKFTAVAYEGGVFLRWHTSFEVDNLGWDMYREVNGEPVNITPGRLAGTMFMFGQGTRLTSGYSYSWWDPAGLITDRYWIEDIDLNGTHTRHGPIYPQEPEDKLFILRSCSPLLSGFNGKSAPYQNLINCLRPKGTK